MWKPIVGPLNTFDSRNLSTPSQCLTSKVFGVCITSWVSLEFLNTKKLKATKENGQRGYTLLMLPDLFQNSCLLPVIKRQTLVSGDCNRAITYQTEYIKDLCKDANYPYDLDVADIYQQWEKDKKVKKRRTKKNFSYFMIIFPNF